MEEGKKKRYWVAWPDCIQGCRVSVHLSFVLPCSTKSTWYEGTTYWTSISQYPPTQCRRMKKIQDHLKRNQKKLPHRTTSSKQPIGFDFLTSFAVPYRTGNYRGCRTYRSICNNNNNGESQFTTSSQIFLDTQMHHFSSHHHSSLLHQITNHNTTQTVMSPPEGEKKDCFWLWCPSLLRQKGAKGAIGTTHQPR